MTLPPQLRKSNSQERRSLRKNTDYAQGIRVADSDAVCVDVHPEDYRELLSFLRAFDLHFQCQDQGLGGSELTFDTGTTVGQVRVALAEFDRLSGQRRH
jgi:hypothetical protein